MTDVLTKEQRSYCMSQIKGKDTKPEVLLRKTLWNLGYRYRLKSRLPGKPDIVFPSRHIVIFVDGCFWHKCPEHFQMPKSNRASWKSKIEANVARDRYVNNALKTMGWKVIRVWEHEVKRALPEVLDKLLLQLNAKPQSSGKPIK